MLLSFNNDIGAVIVGFLALVFVLGVIAVGFGYKKFRQNSINEENMTRFLGFEKLVKSLFFGSIIVSAAYFAFLWLNMTYKFIS